MPNSNQIRDQLINEWRNLVRQWRASCAQWNDPTRFQFEQEIWHEFEQTLPRFLDKLNELNQKVEKARREIEYLT